WNRHRGLACWGSGFPFRDTPPQVAIPAARFFSKNWHILLAVLLGCRHNSVSRFGTNLRLGLSIRSQGFSLRGGAWWEEFSAWIAVPFHLSPSARSCAGDHIDS